MYLVILKYWKQVVGILLILVGLFVMSSSLYNWGARNADARCAVLSARHDAIVAAQTEALTGLAASVVATADTLTSQSENNLAKILLSVKNKPLYTIVDGKCAPSDDFQKTFQDIVREGNKQ